MKEKVDIKIEEDMDFDILKFQNNKYELDDGTVLRVTCVLGKVFKLSDKDNYGNPNYLLNTQIFVVGLVFGSEKGPPPETSQPLDPLKDKREDIGFKPLNEPWNEYELGDGTLLKIRTVVSQIFKYEKRNQFGEPIYQIRSQTLVNKNPLSNMGE